MTNCRIRRIGEQYPAQRPQWTDQVDLVRDSAFVRICLPGVSHSLQRHSPCLCTMSPDEHFIVDRDPADERTLFAAGLSGHGFKFTSVLGEALADLAVAGRTELPVAFLGLGRLKP